MKYAIIENGKVVNIAVATPEVAAERGWVECPEGVGIGWSFDGSGPAIPPPRDIDAEWAEVRSIRNGLLSASDKMVWPDRWGSMTPEKQNEWTVYRQALRDIPQSFSDPLDVVWPQKPQD